MKVILVIYLCVVSIYAESTVKRHPNVRIIGGQIAQDKQFPWQVAVYYDNNNGSFFGSGALIDNKWVLTAGHVTHGARVFTLHLGSNSLVTQDSNRVTIGASYSVTHPDFNPETLDNDIGLIRIDSHIPINDYIQTIPLASSPIDGGVDVTVSGWGATGNWDGVSNDLYYVDLQTITNDDCKTKYNFDVTDAELCTYGPNQGTCFADGGGPLVSEDGNGNFVHEGVAGWASDHGCKLGSISRYTRTAAYTKWIQSVTG